MTRYPCGAFAHTRGSPVGVEGVFDDLRRRLGGAGEPIGSPSAVSPSPLLSVANGLMQHLHPVVWVRGMVGNSWKQASWGLIMRNPDCRRCPIFQRYKLPAFYSGISTRRQCSGGRGLALRPAIYHSGTPKLAIAKRRRGF